MVILAAGRRNIVKKIDAFIRSESFKSIREELSENGFPSLTISEVGGSGRQAGITEHYRGAKVDINVRPQLKLEIVVDDKDVTFITETILKHAKTGKIGDGKIFVLPVEKVIRFSTGESGSGASQNPLLSPPMRFTLLQY